MKRAASRKWVIPENEPGATNEGDKTIRKYTSFDEMKADEYRYWPSRPAKYRGVNLGASRS